MTGNRKGILIQNGTAEEKVHELLKAVGKDNMISKRDDVDLYDSIGSADVVCSIGLGLSSEKDLPIITNLTKATNAVIGCSRPFAEERKWLPLDRFVGISGQKFHGSLYIAIGISGQTQHLRGIQDAGTIVAINIDPNAPIFKNADYGIVGDLYEIVPALTEMLNK